MLTSKGVKASSDQLGVTFKDIPTNLLSKLGKITTVTNQQGSMRHMYCQNRALGYILVLHFFQLHMTSKFKISHHDRIWCSHCEHMCHIIIGIRYDIFDGNKSQ